MANRWFRVSPSVEGDRVTYSPFEAGSDIGFHGVPVDAGRNYTSEVEAYDEIERLAQSRESQGHTVVSTRRGGLSSG